METSGDQSDNGDIAA